MNTERVSGLGRRAALHSALGDPGRLAIVDALVLGDGSPSQLQDVLGMASNLLAHHVGVLAGADVVRRVRSEGDRRRSYLTLVPGALDDLSPTSAVTAPRIVFVCTENAARSQLAAAIWVGLSAVPAESAGTHPTTHIHPRTLAVAQRQDIALTQRPPRALDQVVRRGDMVITVCDRAHEELPTDQRHTHWSIADPARSGTDEAFDRAVDELTDRIARFAPTVRAA